MGGGGGGGFSEAPSLYSRRNTSEKAMHPVSTRSKTVRFRHPWLCMAATTAIAVRVKNNGLGKAHVGNLVSNAQQLHEDVDGARMY